MGLRDLIGWFADLTAPGGVPVRIPPLGETLWMIDRPLIGAVLLVGLWLMVWPRISYLFALVALAVSWLLGGDIAPWGWMARQIGRLPVDDTVVFLALGAMAVALLPFALVRRWRTRDRIVAAALTGSMFVTSLLFHVTVIHGTGMVAMRAHETTLQRLAVLAWTDRATFLTLCQQFQITCRFGQTQELVADQEFFVADYIRWSLDNRPPASIGRRMEMHFTNGSGTNQDGAAPYSFYYLEGPQGEGDDLFMLDQVNLIPAHAAAALTFFMLMFAAHMVWLSLAVAVIVLHDRAFHRHRRGVAAELRQLRAWAQAWRRRSRLGPAAPGSDRSQPKPST